MPLDLPTELLAKVLGLAASQTVHQRHRPYEGRQLEPSAAGRLMVTCKRFREATSCAAFWEEVWVVLPTMTLHHPNHAPLISRLCVNDVESSDDVSGLVRPLPGRASCLIYQPWLPRLKELSVRLLSMPCMSQPHLSLIHRSGPDMPCGMPCVTISQLAASCDREDWKQLFPDCTCSTSLMRVHRNLC